MEQHFSVETKFAIESSDLFTFPPKFWLLLSKEGLGTRIFENGMVSFGCTRPSGQRGPRLFTIHQNIPENPVRQGK